MIRIFRNAFALITGRIKLYNIFHIFNIVLLHNGRIKIGKNVRLYKGSVLKVVEGGQLIIDDDVKIGYDVRISAKRVIIGPKVRINQGSIISGSIVLSENVVVSPNVVIISDKHSIKDSKLSIDGNDHKYGINFGEIVIDSRTYIGAYSIILGNCFLGEGCVVDAMCYIKDLKIDALKIVSSDRQLKIKERL